MTTDPAPRPEGDDDDRRAESSEPSAAPAQPDTETDSETDSEAATEPETDTATESEPFLNPPEHERRPGDG